MHIYILSYKRDEVKTLKYIPFDWLDVTRVVVQERDKDRLQDLPCEKLVLPDNIRDIGATRQWVLEYACSMEQEKILQLDDDLTIGVLKRRGAYNLKDASHEDMEVILKRMESLLDIYPHVGACARNECHLNYQNHIRECARAIRFHGMNTRWMCDLMIDITRVPTIEDYDFILQILRSGVPNAIDCQTYVGDGGSNAEGGCSELRAEARDGFYAEQLKALHPEFVSLVEKATKTKDGVWNRVDVRVQWKKAFESAFAPKQEDLL